MNNLLSEERWKPLYIGSGQLFLGFARFENYLNGCVRFNLSWRTDTSRYVNDRGYAAVVLGSQRFKASRDTIKRLISHEQKLSIEQIEVVKQTLEHCAHIAGLRDKIAHQLILPHPDDEKLWLITDAHSTRDIGAARTWTFSNKDLSNATRDLRDAQTILGAHNQSGTLFKNVQPTLEPWHYKPSELRLLHPDKARDLRERAVLPQSSEG